MNTELRKRLEEATEKYVLSLSLPSVERTYVATKDDFLAGAEYGYKEAIALAKEWLKKNIITTSHEEFEHREYNIIFEENLGGLIADFEAEMNKLWEEKK